MKRYGKSELISVVETLERENEVFEVDEQNLEEAFNMLAQCQETALALGSFLETYGESTQDIISLLEGYCEYLYRMNIKLCNVSERKNIANKIALTLQKIKGLIEEVLPDDKKRIAFFVYKASMWDSLESIWEAAYTDDRCETYVVPIPYFDKLEDGTLTETHYEGGDLPTKVPTEDWREFNPEEFRIDVAYIHNPYDDMNSVTCVHPWFFHHTYPSMLRNWSMSPTLQHLIMLRNIFAYCREFYARILWYCKRKTLSKFIWKTCRNLNRKIICLNCFHKTWTSLWCLAVLNLIKY